MPHGPRIADDTLRSLARERIADGRLHVFFPRSIQAGYGSGASCSLCERPIEPAHIEYEVTDPRDGRQLCFHLACHAVWQLECRAWSLAHDRPADR